MMTPPLKIFATAAAMGAAGVAAPASAQMYGLQQYVSGSLGYALQEDSNNSGAFTRDFVTGDVAAPLGAVTLPSGSDLSFDTDFDGGLFLAAAYGWRFDSGFRVEAELSYTQSDIDGHENVTAAGIALDGADAAVLITGADPLGVTVGDLVADGQGDLSTFAVALNGYYDYRFPDSPFSIYGGVGGGWLEADIDYSPSATVIVDDTEVEAFFQVMAGGAYEIGANSELYAGYRYRQSGDLEVDSALIPATFDVENSASIFEAGVRFFF